VDFERCPKRVAKTIDLIKKAVTHAAANTTGTGWALISQAEFSLMAAQGRPNHRNRQELVALVTATEKGIAVSAREAPLSVAFGIRRQLQARHDLTVRANTRLEWGRRLA
jgi:hypothetical protein